MGGPASGLGSVTWCREEVAPVTTATYGRTRLDQDHHRKNGLGEE